MVDERQAAVVAAGVQVQLLRAVGRWSAGQVATVIHASDAEVLLIVDDRVGGGASRYSAHDAFFADPADIGPVPQR